MTSSTTLGDLSVLNATFNVSADASTGNVSVFFEGRSVSTANSSFSFVGNDTNTSSLRYVNLTLPNSVILEDANDWEFRATCYLNASSSTITVSENVATSSIITGRILDRGGIPAIATTAHAANTEFDDSVTKTITYTVNGANTTGCRIAFGRTSFTGSNTFAMTHSGNSCTYTITKATIADGIYRTYVQASDGTNTSISTGRDFKIQTFQGVASDDVTALSVPIVEKVISDKINLEMVLLIIIFGAFAYMAFFKKK